MNNLRRLISAAVMATVAVTAFAGGLQTGDKCAAYNVSDITGPSKGKTLCYV